LRRRFFALTHKILAEAFQSAKMQRIRFYSQVFKGHVPYRDNSSAPKVWQAYRGIVADLYHPPLRPSGKRYDFTDAPDQEGFAVGRRRRGAMAEGANPSILDAYKIFRVIGLVEVEPPRSAAALVDNVVESTRGECYDGFMRHAERLQSVETVRHF
jgi:hypothetical protein